MTQYVPSPWVTRMQEYCACITHACSSRQTLCPVFNPLSNSQKWTELSNLTTYLTRQRHVHHGQLDRSNPDHTCPGSGAWQVTSTYNSLTYWGYHTWHLITLVHTWGLNKLITLYLSRLLPRTSDKLPRHETISFNIGQSLLPASRLRAWQPEFPTKRLSLTC